MMCVRRPVYKIILPTFDLIAYLQLHIGLIFGRYGCMFNFRDEGAMHQINQITQPLRQASGKTLTAEPCRQPSRLPGLGRSGGHRRAARTIVCRPSYLIGNR